MEEIGRVKQLRGLSFKQYSNIFRIPLHLSVISLSPFLHSKFYILS
jgi:hypothetical protein